MRVQGLAVLCLLSIPVLAPAAAITTIYDAGLGSLPDAQSFNSQVAQVFNAQVSGGVLDVDGYGPGDNAAPGYYTRQNGTFLFSSFVMESRLRIVASTQRSGPGLADYPRGGFILGAIDENGYDLELEFSSGGVWLQTSDGVAYAPPASSFLSLDTSNFHTYRVEADGTEARLFLDGSTLAALTMPLNSLQIPGGGQSTVIFGDASLLTRAHYQMQYFLFSSDTEATVTPEPGALALAGMGLGLVAGIQALRCRATKRPL